MNLHSVIDASYLEIPLFIEFFPTSPWKYHLLTYKLVLHLLEKESDPNAENAKKQTPLHLAAKEIIPSSTNVIKALVRRGAKINAQDANGETALHHAVRTSNSVMEILFPNLSLRQHTIFDWLIVNKPNHYMLIYAIMANKVVKTLIGLGASPNIASKTGQLPLDLYTTTMNEECSKEQCPLKMLFNDLDLNIHRRPLPIEASLDPKVAPLKTLCIQTIALQNLTENSAWGDLPEELWELLEIVDSSIPEKPTPKKCNIL